MDDPILNSTPIRSVCFTGHRELPASRSPDYRRLVANATAAIRGAYERGARKFYCGGAEGFDLLAGKLVLLERSRRPDMQLMLLLPFTGFGDRFNAQDKAELQRQKKAAEEMVFLSAHFFPGCMAIRNRQLVEDADLCIAYLTHSPSGTAQTVGFAREKGIEVIYV